MQEIIISDGFYNNPSQMKTLFSTLDYQKNENLLQGLICPMSFANEDMLHQMEYIVGVPEGSYEFVEGSGTFIINQEKDLPSQQVCTNIPDIMTHWIGIVCLSESEDPHFLKFYKHKRTGWRSIPKTLEELGNETISSLEEFQQFVASENIDNWQETNRIEYAFNKLIMFRPGMFHSYNDVYGETKETGRLLQFFFLRPKISN